MAIREKKKAVDIYNAVQRKDLRKNSRGQNVADVTPAPLRISYNVFEVSPEVMLKEQLSPCRVIYDDAEVSVSPAGDPLP
jgi:hypothetical protein